MNLEQQTLALLKVAEEYRADRSEALLGKAREDSRRILKAANVSARGHLRAMLFPERERLAAEAAVAGGKLLTQRRLRDQRRVVAVLRRAWPRLTQALRARWEEPSGRISWVMHHLEIAHRALPARAWLIQHPEKWPAAEREQARQWLQAHAIEGARFEPVAQLHAGIRVVCDSNVLDASLEGLLADRAQIEGRLLHYLEQEQ